VLSPEQDLDSRKPVWDVMQMFWMDIDPADEIEIAAKVCAESKYTIEELQLIFLCEVKPAVAFNLYSGVAPEWAGFEIGWLTNRILKSHKFGKRLPWRIVNGYSYKWWGQLETAIIRLRVGSSTA
jgi:hypothetical protein